MNKQTVIYEKATVSRSTPYQPSLQKRIPQGWSAIAIGTHGQAVHLKWPDVTLQSDLDRSQQSVRLRFTIAVEMREKIRVEAYTLESKLSLGEFDVRFAYVFQLYEISLSLEQLEKALKEGVGLRIVSEASMPLWIFDELSGDEKRSLFAPHLAFMEDTSRMEQFKQRFISLSSLQPFGWFEGCVLDGLYDFREIADQHRVDAVISDHLQQFVTSEGELSYEDLHGRPSDGRFSGNESTLPVAVIAKRDSKHPIVGQAVEYWPNLADQTVTTAEVAYTVGYPMAVIASRLQDDKLAEQAIEQILIRRDRLIDGNDLYGIVPPNGEERMLHNWARSYTWYMLGMTRVWIELNQTPRYAALPGMKVIEEEIRRMAGIVLSRREPEGLWSCFLGEPETGIETSGSSGIAAALALGAKHGLLDESALDAAKTALQALENYLTPDGLLTGVCQHNCGGLQLQRGGYRGMSQMGMGLMAQLYAAVHHAL